MPCCFFSWLTWPPQRCPKPRHHHPPHKGGAAVLEFPDGLGRSACIMHVVGLSNLMQPVKLGALMWCLVTSALLSVFVLASPSRAQTALETPQQVNDRIRSLSANL